MPFFIFLLFFFFNNLLSNVSSLFGDEIKFDARPFILPIGRFYPRHLRNAVSTIDIDLATSR